MHCCLACPPQDAKAVTIYWIGLYVRITGKDADISKYWFKELLDGVKFTGLFALAALGARALPEYSLVIANSIAVLTVLGGVQWLMSRGSSWFQSRLKTHRRGLQSFVVEGAGLQAFQEEIGHFEAAPPVQSMATDASDDSSALSDDGVSDNADDDLKDIHAPLVWIRLDFWTIIHASDEFRDSSHGQVQRRLS